ncbi:MAG: isocitrate lyase/PEP mutase family protein [Chloroflexi bacterium]|nr:isocitrate lyase/PEP mutase family protein [Chloroflexota bacterium]
MKRTTQLQELYHRGKIFTIAGGACALHAKIAEMAGYECAYMSGGTTSAMILGIADAGLITMSEMVENAGRMADVISIPLISDSDQGFGNAINVRRTVQAFIRAGVAGIHIEDQPMPKRCGFVKGKEVIPLEEAVGKYRAAVDAKMELDPDFVVIARCDARGAAGGSLEDTILRLKAYKQAGVDVLYAEALTSREEVAAVRASVEGPFMGTLGFLNPPPSLEELQKLGYAAAFYPGLIGLPSIEAAWEYAHDFRARGLEAQREYEQRPRKYPMPHIFDLVGFPQVAEWEAKYLPAETLKKYESSIGGYDPRASAKGRSQGSRTWVR